MEAGDPGPYARSSSTEPSPPGPLPLAGDNLCTWLHMALDWSVSFLRVSNSQYSFPGLSQSIADTACVPSGHESTCSRPGCSLAHRHNPFVGVLLTTVQFFIALCHFACVPGSCHMAGLLHYPLLRGLHACAWLPLCPVTCPSASCVCLFICTCMLQHNPAPHSIPSPAREELRRVCLSHEGGCPSCPGPM